MKTTARSRWILDLLFALSLANLCFLFVWEHLLYTNAAYEYWIPKYTLETFLAILINVLTLSLIFYSVIGYLFHSHRLWLAWTSRLFIIANLVFPLNYLRLVLGLNSRSIIWLQDHWWISLPVSAALGAMGLFLLANYLKQMTRIVGIVCLVFSPFAFVNLAKAAWSAIELASAAAPAMPVSQRSNMERKQRVLWLLMDGLDLNVAFLDRPEWLALPELDRLRNQALFAHETIVYSLSTIKAIPSYLLQKIVRRARPIGPANLRLTFMDFENSPDADFSNAPNFFAEAAARGARIAILGYYHPYCRLFGEITEYCRSYTFLTYSPYATNSVLQEAWSQILGITPFYKRFNAIRTYMEATREIQKIAEDPSFDLIFMHASVPHGPFIWDRKAQHFTLFNMNSKGYYGNLILADRLLGAVRTSMERAGLWDNTVVFVTSDHGSNRFGKVPFLLKMPRQKTPFEFALPFPPMRVTRDLLLEILTQRLVAPQAVAEWLEQHWPEIMEQ